MKKKNSSDALKDFVSKCREKYGDMYSYETTIYTTTKAKVDVVCVKHGETHSVTPQNFLNAKRGDCLCRRSADGRCTCGAISAKSTCEKCVARNKEAHRVANGLTTTVCSSQNCDNFCEPDQVLCMVHRKTEAKKVEKIEAKKAEVPEAKAKVVRQTPADHCFYGECKNHKKKDGSFCGKHDKVGRYEEKVAAGLRPCMNWNRGCPDGFEGYVEEGAASRIKRCQKCREKFAEKDKVQRKKKDDITVAAAKAGSSEIPCGTCGKKHDKEAYEIIARTGERTKKCPKCLEAQRNIESQRVRDRDYKPYENQPHVKAKRRQWKIDNPEKTKAYYQEYRRRKLMENPEEYLKRNAEQMKSWRERNPEANAAHRERQKHTLHRMSSVYQKEAREKGVDWKLSDDHFEMLCWGNCFYCDQAVFKIEIQGKEIDVLNGIDRLDSDKHYDLQNCRSCCKQCNRSKGDLPVKAFISQCARIFRNVSNDQYVDDEVWDLIEGQQHSSAFGCSFISSYNSAIKRKIPFELTKEEFDEAKISGLCYLCGEHAPPNQLWGLDRVDNLGGYTTDNVESCCATCNYMKADEDLNDFADRCKTIVERFAGKFDDLPEAIRPNRSRLTKRMTVPDKRLIKLTTVEKKLLIEKERMKVDDLGKGLYSFIECKVSSGKATDEEIAIISRYKSDLMKALKDAEHAKNAEVVIDEAEPQEAISVDNFKEVDPKGDVLAVAFRKYAEKSAALAVQPVSPVQITDQALEPPVKKQKKPRSEKAKSDELKRQKKQYAVRKGGEVRDYITGLNDEDRKQRERELAAKRQREYRANKQSGEVKKLKE